MSDEVVPLSHALLEGARRLGLDHPLATAKVFGTWKELVGEQVAARCEPAGLSQGVLRVWAATPPWAAELRYLAPEVIRRVNAGVGAPVVKELKVSLRPAAGNGAHAGAARAAGGGSRRGAGRGQGVKEWDRYTAEPASPGPPRRPARSQDGARHPEGTRVSGTRIDPDELVRGIPDERLAAATKRALLAAKTHPERG